jgi:2-amino-4-hydroxy-6-hydroxymethyldihydropteridine diphosphokinase
MRCGDLIRGGMRVGEACTVYLGLGSNLGDRRRNLTEALAEMGERGAAVRRVSSFYRTEPLDAPPPWYLNAVAELEVQWIPWQLLYHCLEVECSLGRRSKGDREPRTVDLDVLLYGDLVLDDPALTIPHPRLALRRFVLAPLAELAPDLVVPGEGSTVAELLERCPDESEVAPETGGGSHPTARTDDG